MSVSVFFCFLFFFLVSLSPIFSFPCFCDWTNGLVSTFSGSIFVYSLQNSDGMENEYYRQFCDFLLEIRIIVMH